MMSCRSVQTFFPLRPPLLLFFFIVTVNSLKTSYSIKYLENTLIVENLRFLIPGNVLKSTELININIQNNESSNCVKDLQIWQQQVEKRESWALKMQDASSKIPAGLFQGNIVDLGMYDECMEAGGRFCNYKINLARQEMAFLLVPNLAICLPRSCTAYDVSRLINKTIEANDILKSQGVTIASSTCLKRDSEDLNVWLQFWTIVLYIYTGFFVLGSLCDLTHRWYGIEWTGRNTLARFSILKSGENILSTKCVNDDLAVIHGIRVIATAWIVLVHEFMAQFYAVNVNVLDIAKWFSSWKSLLPLVGLYSVDTFFAISGFLTSHKFFKNRQQNRKFDILEYYLHRFLRLTLPVAVLLLFVNVFVNGSGPRFKWLQNVFVNGLQSKWWSILLYVQNFVQKDNYAVMHLWSLSVDMQLYLLSPFILLPMYKKPKIGLVIVGLLILASATITAVIVGWNRYSAIFFTREFELNHFLKSIDDVYTMPHTRAAPYFLGILFGYETTSGRKISKKWIYLGWNVSFAAFAFCVLGTKSFTEESYVYNPIWEMVFAAIARPLWAFGVCWIIYASTYNFARPIVSFLSWKYFLPFSRITFCVYIFHIVLPIYEVSVLRTPKYFHELYILRSYLSNLMLAVIISFFYSLIFEVPIRTLENIIFRNKIKNTIRNTNKIK